MAGYVLLFGYVYGDARRRGMRDVMWTLLAIFLINGIGIILYFILREPLLLYCSKCGAGVTHSARAAAAACNPPVRSAIAPSSPAGRTAPGAESSSKLRLPTGYNPQDT